MNVARRPLSLVGHCQTPYRRTGLAAFVALTILVSGCAREELSTRYGRHRLTGETASVNGTDVLAGMFTAAGHEVHFRRTLVTGEMENADIVVWFPDTEAAPSDEVCEWFDAWLTEYPGRTLVYVGRDFSAGPIYYDFLMKHRLKQQGKAIPEPKQPDSSGEKQAGAKQAEAKSQASKPNSAGKSASKSYGKPKAAAKKDDEDKTKGDAIGGKPAGKKGDQKGDEDEDDDERRDSQWFTYQPGDTKQVRKLAGPWSKGIDGLKTEIELRTRLVPHEVSEKLLTSGGEVIVSSESKLHWDESQIIYVANGSFLLNLPLINHEHRKLAGKLIEATGEPAQVVFLESGKGGPPIDPPHTDNSVWTLFQAWPLGTMLLQLAAVGLIYCFAKWPIFGRPQQAPPDAAADFSKHVTAVGQLLARTKDRQFALAATGHADPPPETFLPHASAPPSAPKGN